MGKAAMTMKSNAQNYPARSIKGTNYAIFCTVRLCAQRVFQILVYGYGNDRDPEVHENICRMLSVMGKNCNFVRIMRKLLIKTGRSIQIAIDFTYPLFRRFMPLRLYRYGVCGCTNVVCDWGLYFFVYNFILKYRLVDVGPVTISPHIASLAVIFPVTTISGFLLQKYVTFTASELRGRVQLVRYLTVILTNLLINYAGLKLMVDGLNFYPTPSKMAITIVTVICSYIGQHKFTFKTVSHPEKAEKTDSA
jgi:putative flippase GtrA